MLTIRADEVRVGDFFNSHADVFWQVTEIEYGRRQPDDVTIRCVHERAWTYGASDLVQVQRDV